jgi:RNA polymerase sigma-70 factor, ECF subfamily
VVPPAEPDRSTEDRELLARMRAGGTDAFDTLFRAYYPGLVGAAAAMVGDRDLAEEVAQEVMVELWRRRADLQIEGGLRAYLHRAARNRTLNRIRHERTVRAAQPHIASGTAAPRAADSDVRENEIDDALTRALSAMPPRCREIFELSRIHGLRYGEIAAELDISIKTVEAQMGKALRIVREHLDPWLGET